MSDVSSDMIRRIHETKAVSIWNSTTGPVFWYAASVPGPFYVNTELVIGPELAAHLLDTITTIVAETPDSHLRAARLNDSILNAYKKDSAFQQVIAALATKAKTEFPAGTYDVISGGERRDWLFSIPLAEALSVRHVFLFKNEEFYCPQPLKAGEKALHVADLINNAASYFDAWFPILAKAQLPCIGTLCINTRGSNGLKRLHEAGQKVVALNAVDIGFFERLHDNDLLVQAAVDEIAVYFDSPQKWAERYLMNNTKVFDALRIDKKSFERLENFFQNDPWGLRSKYPDFFIAMEQAILQRKANP